MNSIVIPLQEYVEAFRRQFVQLFVGRPELLLNPMNEFGLRVRSRR